MKIINFIFTGLLFTPFLFRLDSYQVKSDNAVVIDSKNFSVGQTFKAGHNNIYMIRINMNNPQLAYKLPLVFSLKENPGDSKTIYDLTFNGSNIGSNYWLQLKFPPIPDSLNKSYIFQISSPITSPDLLLEFRHTKENKYQGGSTYINNRLYNGDLVFKVYYKTSIQQFISDSISDFSSRLQKDPGFIAVYLALLIAFLFLTLYAFKTYK